MEEKKWMKQISQDNSIQFLLCEHFTHQTIADCVVVGNSSFRLLILQSTKIKEVARHDHQRSITSACITYNEGQPEIAFISSQSLFFMIPKINSFEITKTISLNFKYSSIISNYSLLCLYPRNSSITFYEKSTNKFIDYNVGENTKIWSCAFLNEYLFTLEYQNLFKVKIYSTNNLDLIHNVSFFVINYFIPYKLVSVLSHKAVYVLCESSLMQIKQSEPNSKNSINNNVSSSFSNGWVFSKFTLDIRKSDPLLVDAAPCGVRLFVLSAGGLILRFDGVKFERAGEVSGATNISSMAISRVLVTTESCRVKLYDGNITPLDELSNPTCIISQFSNGNFTISSQFSIHSIFYDYGIEVDKYSPIKFKSKPTISIFKDCCFLLFNKKTVVIDSDFRDVTPSAVRKCTFERVHANNRNSFFALTSDRICVYEYGNFSSYDGASTLSSHRLNMLVTSQGELLTMYYYSITTLIKRSVKKLSGQISSLLFESRLYVSLFDQRVLVLDDDLNELKCVEFDYLFFSMVQSGDHIVMGTGTGELVWSNLDLAIEKVESIGNSTVHLNCVGDEVTAFCDNLYFYLGENEVKKLPSDFLFFAPFSLHKAFLGLLKKSKKGESHSLIQIHFADKSLGFHSKVLYEFNQPVTKLCTARGSPDFVCCLNKSTLMWSRGDVKYDLLENEEAVSINEWQAKYQSKIIQLWMVCTRSSSDESRLLIFSQSQSSNKVHPLFQKVFKTPIAAFCTATNSLAFFVTNDLINGISLETGSLKPKAKSPAKVAGVVAIDSTEKYLAALADRNEFSLFLIASDMELKCLAVVKKLGIFGRLKIIGEFVAVSSRMCPSLYLYKIEKNGLEIVKEVNFLSPVTAIFPAGKNFLCSCICGEIFIMACEKDAEIDDLQLSKLFSFGQSVFSIADH